MWLLIAVVIMPLAALALYPDAVAPVLKRAVASPLDLAWSFIYSMLFVVGIWHLTRVDRRATVTGISALLCLAPIALYGITHARNALALALIVPPIVSATAMHLFAKRVRDEQPPPPNKSLERTRGR